MKTNEQISRNDFIKRAAAVGAATAIAPLISKAEHFSLPGKRVRIAIIGCGSVSTQYLPHLSASEYVELVSTCDIIIDRAVKAAEKYKVPNHYSSIEKMLEGAPFDLMVNLSMLMALFHMCKAVLITSILTVTKALARINPQYLCGEPKAICT